MLKESQKIGMNQEQGHVNAYDDALGKLHLQMYRIVRQI